MNLQSHIHFFVAHLHNFIKSTLCLGWDIAKFCSYQIWWMTSMCTLRKIFFKVIYTKQYLILFIQYLMLCNHYCIARYSCVSTYEALFGKLLKIIKTNKPFFCFIIYDEFVWHLPKFDPSAVLLFCSLVIYLFS